MRHQHRHGLLPQEITAYAAEEALQPARMTVGASDDEVEEKWKVAQRMRPFSTTGIKGTPSQVVEQLRERVKMGITFFTILFGDFGPPATIDLFAREVMPAFA